MVINLKKFSTSIEITGIRGENLDSGTVIGRSRFAITTGIGFCSSVELYASIGSPDKEGILGKKGKPREGFGGNPDLCPGWPWGSIGFKGG